MMDGVFRLWINQQSTGVAKETSRFTEETIKKNP